MLFVVFGLFLLVKGMSCCSQILWLLFCYCYFGVFLGMNLDVCVVYDLLFEGNLEQFVIDLEVLGFIFVKFGQMFFIWFDMVLVEFVIVLEWMQEKVVLILVECIYVIIEQELGVLVFKLFFLFDLVLLGCVLIVQVYCVVLYDGCEVVVKVQKLEVVVQFCLDLEVLCSFVLVVDYFIQVGCWVCFCDWFNEFVKILMQELDYQVEVENLQCFGQYLCLFKLLWVLQLIWDYCSYCVLMMELVQGVCVDMIFDVCWIE